MKQAFKGFADPGAKCAQVEVYIRKTVTSEFRHMSCYGHSPSHPKASVMWKAVLFMRSQGIRAVLHFIGGGNT